MNFNQANSARTRGRVLSSFIKMAAEGKGVSSEVEGVSGEEVSSDHETLFTFHDSTGDSTRVGRVWEGATHAHIVDVAKQVSLIMLLLIISYRIVLHDS